MAAGTYDEQVVINKSLTLQGAGDTTVIQPSQTTASSFQLFNRFPGKPNNTAPIVVTDGTGNTITIKNLKIDGSRVTSVSTSANFMVGILYRGTGGLIDTVTVDGMKVTNKDLSIRLCSMETTINVEVKGCTISNLRKGGIHATDDGLTTKNLPLWVALSS